MVREWWKERQLRKAQRELKRVLDASMAGKPSWTMSARLLMVNFMTAQNRLTEYLTALEAGDKQAARIVGEAIHETLGRAIEVTRDIPHPRSQETIDALTRLATATKNLELPEMETIDKVHAFISEVYT